MRSAKTGCSTGAQMAQLFRKNRVSAGSVSTTSRGSSGCECEPYYCALTTRPTSDSSFALSLAPECGATEAPISRQRTSAKNRPKHGLCQAGIFLQTQTGEIPEGERPHDNYIQTHDNHDRRETDGDRHHSSGQALEQQHAPMLIGRIGSASW